MKAVEKYVGLTAQEVQTLLPNLKQAAGRIYKDYESQTHPKLKMLDSLIVLSIATFIVQLVYANALVFSRDPFNSYLAGIFCSVGQFALAGNPIHLIIDCSVSAGAVERRELRKVLEQEGPGRVHRRIFPALPVLPLSHRLK